MIVTKQIKTLKTEIEQANYVTFLTGAGVSTPSGIPDYRSKNGIYNDSIEKPETILSAETLYHRPELFYHFVLNNMYFPDAKPNIIHQKIAEICNNKGHLITQNVDSLDLKAGNQQVTQFHGNLYQLYYTKCQQTVKYSTYAQSYLHHNCGGIIRPQIVLYGENINSQNLTTSIQAIQKADLVIICGTSFVVYPFAQLLAYCQTNAKIWAINKTAIPLAGIAAITGDALDVFKQI